MPALTAAILRILTEPATARRMSGAARRSAAARFDERVVFEKVRDAYRRLLRAKGLPVPAVASGAARQLLDTV